MRLIYFAATLLAVLAIGGMLLAGASRPAHAQVKLRLSLSQGYIPVFKQKRRMNGLFRPRLKNLRQQLFALNRSGRHLPCSTQILKEAKWLMNYTNRVEDLARRLDDLENSLPIEDQSFARRQSEKDGSWGACFKEWFYRLHTSVDPLKELNFRGEKPKLRLAFLDPINTPEKLTAMFRSLLVSNVDRDGINHRKELNLIFTGLGQLLLLPKLAGLFPKEFPRDKLAAALIRFIDDEWQNPISGYWGAWYDIDGKIYKTDDLSITFHIISYRQDQPKHLRKLADTTFSIRSLRYPYGWRDRGTQNNHHAYDVVRLLRRTWTHMVPEQRARASAEITIMAARSLGLSLRRDGSFIEAPYDSVPEAYYFGISFLDEIGFFRPSRRFWTSIDLENGDLVRKAISARLAALKSSAPMALEAMRKLQLKD